MATSHQAPSLNVPSRPMATLYVGDLDPQVTETDLSSLFSSVVGPILSLKLCRCRLTGRSLCYAYVNLFNCFQAQRALCVLNHIYLKGRPIRIMWSQRNPISRKNGLGNLYVKNLDDSIDSTSLHSLFSKFGNVLSCKVAEENGKSKGFGFVQFDSENAALAAKTALHDTFINDKKLYVSKFVRRSERKESGEELKFRNLYVKNLADGISEESFKNMFSEFGEITSAVIVMDNNGKSRGFGFVNFKSPEDARKAVDALNGFQLESGTLYVGRAQTKVERTRILKHEYKDNFKNEMIKLKASNLYVKNLASGVDDCNLRELFGEFGKIISAKVMGFSRGASRGFGFVSFSNPDEAHRALHALNGSMFQGKRLYVAIAQNKKDRQLELQNYYMRFQCQPPYASTSSILGAHISALYPNFYVYPQSVPFHALPYQHFSSNMGFQYPYAARSYHQPFSTYVSGADMYQGSRKPTDPSSHLPAPNYEIHNSGYKKTQRNGGGTSGKKPKRSTGKSKKDGKRPLHPHLENIQPDLPGQIAELISEMNNSLPSNLMSLPADRATKVLKEVNTLKDEDASSSALPKIAARCLNY